MAILPAIFFGHGNPMNALLHNAYTEGWATIGDEIPRPKPSCPDLARRVKKLLAPLSIELEPELGA
jgi:hypothetical protein